MCVCVVCVCVCVCVCMCVCSLSSLHADGWLTNVHDCMRQVCRKHMLSMRISFNEGAPQKKPVVLDCLEPKKIQDNYQSFSGIKNRFGDFFHKVFLPCKLWSTGLVDHSWRQGRCCEVGRKKTSHLTFQTG